MAVSTYDSYKLLNAWQRIMGEEVWHFNQVSGNGVPKRENAPVYLQPTRDDIARSLYEAVQAWVGYSLYYPRPTYITEELVPLGGGHPYQLQTLTTTFKHLEAFGSRGTTVIQSGASVAYTDTNQDGVNDRATITVNTSITDPDEIGVFFRTADGAPAAADERYEIEPLTVSISGGVATITGHRALFVKPDKIWDNPYEVDSGNNYTGKNTADTADATDFVTLVDVYRVYTDTTNAVQLVSDDYLFNCDCSSTSSTLTAAGARIVDKRLGLFEVRAASCGCNRPYEAVKVNYLAGLPLVNGRIAPDVEKALVRLANTYMWQKPCSLYEAVMNKWVEDRQPMAGELLEPSDVKNPFGLKVGQVMAWQALSRPSRTIGQGGKLTRVR